MRRSVGVRAWRRQPVRLVARHHKGTAHSPTPNPLLPHNHATGPGAGGRYGGGGRGDERQAEAQHHLPDDESIPFLLGRAISQHLSQMESVFIEQYVAPRFLASALPHPLSHSFDAPPFHPHPQRGGGGKARGRRPREPADSAGGSGRISPNPTAPKKAREAGGPMLKSARRVGLARPAGKPGAVRAPAAAPAPAGEAGVSPSRASRRQAGLPPEEEGAVTAGAEAVVLASVKDRQAI